MVDQKSFLWRMCAALFAVAICTVGCAADDPIKGEVPQYTYEPKITDKEHAVNLPTYEPDVVTVSPSGP
jgi:hypothetical protein